LVPDPGPASKVLDSESGFYPVYPVQDTIDVNSFEVPICNKKEEKKIFYSVGYVFFFLSGSGFTGLGYGSLNLDRDLD